MIFLVAGGGASLAAEEASSPEPMLAPRVQAPEEARAKSDGCVSCHTSTDQPTMHVNPAVILGCTDCHGGDATVSVLRGASEGDPAYEKAKTDAHVPSRYPEDWGGPANPERSFTLLNRDSPEYVRFVNPSDLRVVREACGSCHLELIQAVERSLMASVAMFWGGAAYNNGVLPFKRYVLGEAYTRDGKPGALVNPELPTPDMLKRTIRPYLIPLPAWETVPPGDNFRVFERGGRNILSIFPEIGLPNPLEEPGKPDIRSSNRGLGTGQRVSIPVLNLAKTRLNDPSLWFLGTSDQPGDFRSSGCAGCHVVYANDRDPTSSGEYAKDGHWGQSVTVDPTISSRMDSRGEPERGHPLRHEFTRAIPTSQCMTCHHHQPNVFVNSFLGYTMWDYESDGDLMWPQKQRYPSSSEMLQVLERNPEGAAVRGLWGDVEFLGRVSEDINPRARHTQFADYHGHGWNFRAVFKRARDGTLLDAHGAPIDDGLPPSAKWKKAVHLKDIHAEGGMQCADCHYSQDSHGTGHLHSEVAAAIEIRCHDCHGAVDRYATLRTSGPAAPPGGTNLGTLRNMDGRRRFVWRDGRLYQRLILPPHQELEVTQVKDSVDPSHESYNPKAARSKTMLKGMSQTWGPGVVSRGCERAHNEKEMACYTCHSSWVTSCAGCHLPIQANWKTKRQHYEGGETRNFATYNPQVARDQMFQIGIHGEAKEGIIAPIRSSSALVLSSVDANRAKIYIQQPPISSGGFSSQAFAPNFPHTVRKTETKSCADCHVSAENDNNAIMAQLLLLGTQFVNFVGYNAWVGTEASIEAIRVTEWEEPQAVIGSYLHKIAYPDWYGAHQERGRELEDAVSHHAHHATCTQLRGEYLFVAEGSRGAQVYDVAQVANKGFSEPVVTSPFSPLGQNTRIDTKHATCIVLPTNQPIRPDRNRDKRLRSENLEQEMHPIYSYAAITDAEEGLILTNVETLADGEPRNNFLRRALTWNPDGILDGALHAHFAGPTLYVAADRGIVVVDLDEPLKPKVAAVIPLEGARASVVQFRYLFVLESEGLKVVDVTHPARPRVVEGAFVPIETANQIYIARTYAYVAAGADGLVIVDIERPESPSLYMRYDADGALSDARDVVVASTNASLFAYVADGLNGLKVVQLTSPESQPKFYGFTPEPKPQLIAWRKTETPALSLSRGLERDRAVDESGHQIAVFGRIGSRPFNLEEMQRLFLDPRGDLWRVEEEPRRPVKSLESCEQSASQVEGPGRVIVSGPPGAP